MGSSATIKTPMGLHNSDMEVDFEQETILNKFHHPPECVGIRPLPEKLILLVRNPLESITRHDPASIPAFTIPSIRHYISLLYYYDLFENEKMIVFYEDLIKDETLPHTLNEILDFLGEPKDNLIPFMEGIEYHRSEGVRIYNTNGNRSQTEGNEENYHRKKIKIERSLEKLLEWDQGGYFHKYCHRYL